MAETIGDLYIRLGLSYDELNQDFVAVEETLSANIERLNRENRLIQLKANIDLVGATEAAEKLKIQQEALTKQIELQAQKVKLYEAEWKSAAKANGEASKQAQKAEIALKQQEMALEKLKQKLQAVAAQQQEIGKSAASGAGGGILDVLSNIKGDISGGVSKLTNTFGELKEASGSAGGALSKAIELISGIPSPAGKAVAALAAIPLVIKGIESSILSMSEQAMTQGDSFYVFSRGLQVSIAEAKELSMVCKVTGIEMSEVAATTKRVATSFMRAGDKTNLMTQTLQRYGVELKNSNGEMKNTLEMSKALAAGLAKAQAEGQGKEFIASVFGRFASGDYITYLEDLAGNIEFAKKVIKNGLEDPVLAHSVQGEMNALNAQIDEAGNAFSYALLPVANKIIPELREQFGALTKVIADNADGIRNMGYAFGEAAATASSLVTGMAELAAISAKVFAPAGQKKAKYDILERYKDDTSIKSFNDLLQKELARMSTDERRLLETSERQYAAYVNFLRSVYPEIEKLHAGLKEEAAKSWADFKRESDKIFSDEEIQRSLERVKKYTDELAHIKIDLQFGNDSYGKAIAELDLQYQKGLEQAEGFLQERNALTEWYNAKRELIERQHAEKTAKIREDSLKRANKFLQEAASIEYHATHNSLQNQLYDIESWKQAQLEKAQTAEEVAAIIANAAAKEEAAIQKSLERARTLLNEAADREYGLTHSAFEKQLYDIERWKQAQLEKAETAEEIAATVANAASREAEAFEREVQRIKGVIESAQDRLARLRLSQRDYDLYRARKQYEQDIKEMPEVLAQDLLYAELSRIEGRRRGISLGYTDTPPQYFKDGDEAKVREMFQQLQKRLPSLATVNPEVYARYFGAERERQQAKDNIAKTKNTATTVTASFSKELKASTGNLTNFSKALKNAIDVLQGKPASFTLEATADGNADRSTEFKSLIDLFGNWQGGEAPIIEMDALHQSIENLDDDTRAALNAILDKVPEGINVDSIRELIRESSDGKISIVYMNELFDALDSLPANIKDELVDVLNGQMPETPDLPDVTPIEELVNAAENAVTPIEELVNAAENAGTATIDFAEKLNQTIAALDTLREKIETMPAPVPTPPAPVPTPPADTVNKALGATATIGELTALGGVVTLQPELATLGVAIETIANTAKTLLEVSDALPKEQPPQSPAATGVDLSALQQPLAEINTSIQGMSTELSTKLAEVAQGISALTQTVSANQNKQPPQINVNVNPTIDLGGAYVFDDEMKRQLTDDIATEVADAVTSAVQTATSQSNYGYGN